MAKKQKRPGPAAVIGGMVAGFDQQVFRTTPPPHELVHHARPDDPVPTKDGGLLIVGIPGLDIPGAAPRPSAAASPMVPGSAPLPAPGEPTPPRAPGDDPPQAEPSSAPEARR